MPGYLPGVLAVRAAGKGTAGRTGMLRPPRAGSPPAAGAGVSTWNGAKPRKMAEASARAQSCRGRSALPWLWQRGFHLPLLELALP